MVSALEARGLVLDYPGPLRALAGVDLALSAGELAAVIGPNGSGKSTLVRCLAGWLAPTAGQVLLCGEPLARFRPRERAKAIAVVPQFLPALFDVRVGDFVLGGRYAHLSRWRSASARDRDVVARALEQCDALDVSERLLTELSGGQRQRVLVARAIAQEAGILMVDEPTSSLDPEHQLAVFELLAALAREGRAVLVVTHELNLASQFAERVALFDGGRIVASGPPSSVLTRAVLEPVYGANLYYGELPARGAGAPRPFVIPFPRLP